MEVEKTDNNYSSQYIPSTNQFTFSNASQAQRHYAEPDREMNMDGENWQQDGGEVRETEGNPDGFFSDTNTAVNLK